MSNNFKIDLNGIIINKEHRLSIASAAQIVKSMAQSIKQFDNLDNEYQQVLYPFLSDKITLLSKEFQDLLHYDSEKERNVKSDNLCSRLPNTTEAGPSYHNKIRLYNANFGPLLEALKQRVSYILTRDTPQKYLNTKDDTELVLFTKLKSDLQPFLNLLDAVFEEFKVTLNKAREHVNMDEVVNRRKEKREHKKFPLKNKFDKKHSDTKNVPTMQVVQMNNT